jgi:hypothetical protein
MALSPRRAGAVTAAMAAVLVPAAVAWACVAVVSLTLASSTVQPGGTLTVTGREFSGGVPVQLHLDSATGPVLATVAGTQIKGTMTSSWTQIVTVPANVSSGPHLLLATQDQHDMNSGAPARAAFYVGTSAPAPAAVQARPLSLAVSSGPSASGLVVIALVVAGAALLVAGLGIYLASRGSARTRSGAVAS